MTNFLLKWVLKLRSVFFLEIKRRAWLTKSVTDEIAKKIKVTMSISENYWLSSL